MKVNLNNTIELGLVTVGYDLQGKGTLEILKDISFSARKGEMVALIGSNGIGKSTLLRTMAGFQKYFKGSIKINNRELSQLSPDEMARIMSFVSTENVRISNMTVFDLVSFGRFPYTNWLGRLTEEDNRVVSDAMASVGLTGFENRQVTRISDGERQRAMIARAIAQDTPVIFLDEPTAFLDVSNKYEIFHLLQILAREQEKTIILSTHDLHIALREVDKLWVLTPGCHYQGAPEDAVLDECLDKLFTNAHIGFDPQEGEYYFKKEFRAKVRVEGSGLPLIWTLRALNRHGYQIVVEADPDFTIKAYPDKWILLIKDMHKEFSTIYDLLIFLQSEDLK